jgi:hypothetical protein
VESYYEKAVEKWLRAQLGEVQTQNNASELLGEAYGKAATAGNALAGIRVTGIRPVNRRVDFAPSEILRASEHFCEKDIT